MHCYISVDHFTTDFICIRLFRQSVIFGMKGFKKTKLITVTKLENKLGEEILNPIRRDV